MNLKTLRLQYWDARPLGERRMILAGAALLLPLLAYFLLWQPAHVAVAQLHAKLPRLHIQAEQMQKASAQIAALRHRPQLAVMNAMTMTTALEESATRHQLRDALTTVTAQEPNGTRITISAISFEKWLDWLRELQQSQHIRINSIAITPLTEPGMVTIRATLTNGGSE